MARHKSRSNAGRNTRLAEQIQKDLAQLIQREFNVSEVGLITVSGVDLSADYAHAKAYFTVLGAEAEMVQDTLNSKSGWLHSLLFKMVHIHTVPSLRFIHDDQVERGIAMSQLIEKADRPHSSSALEDESDEQS